MILRFKLGATLLLALLATGAKAGGILTNTNQSINFLRNPARDGAIGIDGVYSNPAGVAFLNQGFHLGVNWQSAWQTRTITTTNPIFAYGMSNNGATTKTFKGDAKAPVIPSVQAAYNTGKWSFQFNFAITGGGGKSEFKDGLGSFEGAVGQIATGLKPFGATGYDMSNYMQGRQYYFGFTIGTAYKVTDNLSVYGGVRALYGTASYKAKISNIRVNTANGPVAFGDFLDATDNYIATSLVQVNAGIAQLEPVKTLPGYREQYNTLVATKASLEGAQPQVAALEAYRNGINLQSDQTGFGLAPIIGVDYKTGNFNFGAKYEFRTKMSMKNKSTVSEPMSITAVNQFVDGTSIREDSPALLTVGGQWSVLPNVRLNAGYHHFYDKQAKKYDNKQDLLSKGTDEYLGGVEWDPIEKLTVSGGFQITDYGITDSYMNDISFVVSSWSFGLGAKYQISDKVAVNVAYFKTNYDSYTTAPSETGVQNTFNRTNKVFGAGVEVDF